jgi:hypothetical protein
MTPLQETRTFDTIRSLTNDLVSQKISDTITAQIPLINLLDKVGNKELESGGYQYRMNVLVELNQAQAYSGTTVLDADIQDGVTTAIFNRKQLTVPIVLTGTQMLQNSGNDPTAIVDFVAAQMEIAELAMKNAIGGTSLGIMSAWGESDVGITGLRNMLTDSTTTGTCGGLSRATYTSWQHQSDTVTTGFNTDGLVSMNNLWLACMRGEELPGVVVFTRTGFANLIRSLQGTINYNQPSPNTAFGDIGFDHINYMGATCLFDAGVTSQRAYFLNLKYLKLLVHKDRDMAIRDFVTPENQDGLIGRLYWAGNLVTNNLARQGLLQGLPDTWA